MKELLLKELYYNIKKELGQEYDIQIKTVVKNNNKKLTGFMIWKSDEQVATVIYVDSLLSKPDFDLSLTD